MKKANLSARPSKRESHTAAPRQTKTTGAATLTRNTIRQRVLETLEPLEFVHALWESGSAAFHEADNWSDIDLNVCVDDGRIDDAFRALEDAFARHMPVERRVVMPEPTWHGHAQRIYRFRDAPPWLLLDLCIQKRSATGNRLIEPEIHGTPRFLFDRAGIREETAPLDPAEHEKRLRARLATLVERVSLFSGFVEKELRRRHPTDAISFYHTFVIAPLVEALRIRHDPWRHDWGLRHLHRCLHRGDLRKLENLLFIRHPDELSPKTRAALRWFHALARDIESRTPLVRGRRPPSAPNDAGGEQGAPAPESASIKPGH